MRRHAIAALALAACGRDRRDEAITRDPGGAKTVLELRLRGRGSGSGNAQRASSRILIDD
jgi:hypothetical protein